MTHTDLKQAIRDFCKCLYKAEFIGRIDVIDLDPTGYRVDIYVNRSECPISIISDLQDNEFLEYLKNELRVRNLVKFGHTNVLKILPENYYDRIGVNRKNRLGYLRTCNR